MKSLDKKKSKEIKKGVTIKSHQKQGKSNFMWLQLLQQCLVYKTIRFQYGDLTFELKDISND